MEKLEALFFVGCPGALPITLPILFVPARFALFAWTKHHLTLFPRRCCNTNLGTAILNLNIRDNKIIHQVPLIYAQQA